MFQSLIESGPRASAGMRRYLASFGIHGLLIVAAVMATRRSLDAARQRPAEVAIPIVIRSPAPVLPRQSSPLLPRAPDFPSDRSPLPQIFVPIPEVSFSGVSSIADLLERTSSERSRADLSRWGLVRAGRDTDGGPLPGNAVDEPVTVTRQGVPEYPPALAKAGIPGKVELEYVVDTAGVVEPSSLRVLGSTHPAFEGAARRAIMASRFRPAKLNGRVVRQLVRQTLTFRVGG